MRKVTVESWTCGECSTSVDAEALFAWCDGCSKVMCTACLESSATCEHCDMIVCKHCAIRFFTLDCAACGFALHLECVERRGGEGTHALCTTCGESAAAMIG